MERLCGLIADVWYPVFTDPANTFTGTTTTADPYKPQKWAQEALMVLESNLTACNLVYRDFDPLVAQYGDTINCRRPGTFTMKRKGNREDVTVQAATADNFQVVLNQHNHVSFFISDGEESKGFVSLRETYLVPAVKAIAQAMDQMVIQQCYTFLPNTVGQLSTAVTQNVLTDLRTKMNVMKIPTEGRSLILNPTTEGDLLKIANFTLDSAVNDQNRPLVSGFMGRRLGFDMFMSQNAPSFSATDTVHDSNSYTTAAFGIGTTSITADSVPETITIGSWITIAGDMTPQLVTDVSGSAGGTQTLVISPGLKYAVTNDAQIYIYEAGVAAAAYAANWIKSINTGTGPDTAPVVGQMVSISPAAGGRSAAACDKYGILSIPSYQDSTSTGLVTGTAVSWPSAGALNLNRGVDGYGISSGDIIGYGPSGNYNFAFNREAIALVTRPLKAPDSGTGARSAVVNYNGLGLRVTITYDGRAQGHLVTVDLLAGIKTLNADLGCVLLG